MQEHDAKNWLRATKRILRTITYVDHLADDSSIKLEVISDCFDFAMKQCSEIGLVVSAELAREAKAVFDTGKFHDRALISRELEGLHNTIEAELRSILFLRVEPDFTKYAKDIQPFGSAVADRFPLAIRDIEQGGKALAFGLGTACVFHMMRVMEVALKALAKPLGIPYAPSWESYLNQIEKKIAAKHGSKSAKWKKDEPFYRDLSGDLQMIKIAWRNPTMHIVRHYDQDEGEDIYRAVRRLMRRLADRFDERGRAVQQSGTPVRMPRQPRSPPKPR